ncbi:hypothetical protein G7048_20515 [Diaphorobacter sp. HDW4B]|uniref:hypothetical protein n=1 Tax=Diaphorobacter sp. HDW4B TaxID=2714925 RepID=UPI00140D6A3E|nr:hypothetical protein [Diaphorobacter sp. HDW4B]QIL72530.1 hypothetical protein G7048_20515 [Diaphorobacter sp. HDW4B]
MKKFALSVAALLAYVVLAILSYYLYIHLLRVNVVFYSAIAAALLALVPYALVLCTSPFRGLAPFEKLQNIAIAALTGYALAISVPTVIDRSLSFYLIEKLQQRGGGIQLSKIDQVFKDEYVREHRLMDIRLTEQVASGTIVIRPDGCIRLTQRGEFLASSSRFFRRHFLPKERLINGNYSDALVDPFAHSAPAPDYLCR